MFLALKLDYMPLRMYPRLIGFKDPSISKTDVVQAYYVNFCFSFSVLTSQAYVTIRLSFSALSLSSLTSPCALQSVLFRATYRTQQINNISTIPNPNPKHVRLYLKSSKSYCEHAPTVPHCVVHMSQVVSTNLPKTTGPGSHPVIRKQKWTG